MTLGSAASIATAPMVRLHCVSVSGIQYPPLELRQTPPEAVPMKSVPPAGLGTTAVTRPASSIGPELKKPLSAPKIPLGPSDRHPPATLPDTEKLKRACNCDAVFVNARCICS